MDKPIALDEKQKALLLKLRKGADASLSLGQLWKVLGLLGGWKIEERVGLVAMHIERGEEERETAVFQHLRIANDEPKARAAYDAIKAVGVKVLPRRPELGGLYVMELEAFRSWKSPYGEGTLHGASYKLWAGAPGFLVTSPCGRQFHVLPSRYDLSKVDNSEGLATLDLVQAKKRLRPYDVLNWLKESTPYLRQICDALGMEEHVPAAARTRDNTGTCGCCFRNIKLEEGKTGKRTVVLHGYNRPGWGHIVGHCPGQWNAPYELSDVATRKAMEVARARAADLAEALARLDNPELKELTVAGYRGKLVTWTKDDPMWAMHLADHRRHLTYQKDSAEHEAEVYAWLVQDWKLRELPTEGGKEIFYLDVASRVVRAAKGKG